MADSSVRAFTDPSEFESAVRASDLKLLITASGNFRAELTRIDFPDLWMQRGWESLPHVTHRAIHRGRSPIFFRRDCDPAPVYHSGVELPAQCLVVFAPGSEHHQRSVTERHWGSMSLTPEALAKAGRALVGYEPTPAAATHVIRPSPARMSRLLQLHDAAGHLAATAPDLLAHEEVAKAMEQELVHAMIACLTEGAAVADGGTRRTSVMQRFEEALEAKRDWPVYLAEICSDIGVSERTLRLHCQEQLGMGPHRYLWLRRMHLVRRALARADASSATVTGIATNHGFGELGRFAVAYRRVFGETPSVTLRRPPDDRPVARKTPIGWRLPILP